MFVFDPKIAAYVYSREISSDKSLTHFNIDRELNYFMRWDDSTSECGNLIGSINRNIWSVFQSEGIKAIRPRYEADGNRVFFYHNRSILFQLAYYNYSIIQVLQSYSTDNSELGFAIFSSGVNGFAYEFNKSKIYAYCESLTISWLCPLSISLPCSVNVKFCI